MDYEEKQKRQMLRVIIAEIGMVLSVVAIVVVATMAAMGFFISGDGQLEQSGLMQIHSLPTGATVELDGNILFSRTNLSRTMAAGEHYLKLSKDGYDTWEKAVMMYSGALVRLYYPRLFLQDRIAESVLELGEKSAETGRVDTDAELEFYQPSSDRGYILYAMKGAANWHLINTRGDEIKETLLDVSGVLPGMESEDQKVGKITTVSYRFGGVIEELKWSANSEKVLAKIRVNDQISWVLVNLKRIEESLDLTKTFGLDFERVEMIDNAASRLYVLENGQLRIIDVASEQLSKVLLSGVDDFMNSGANVIYVTPENLDQTRSIGTFREGEKGGAEIAKIKNNEEIHVALVQYYDEDYICYSINQKLYVLYGELPSYKDDESSAIDNLKVLINNAELSFVPETLSVSPDGEYLMMQQGKRWMVADLDSGNLVEYESVVEKMNWLDASMLYAVCDGEILVWDFDGQNQRNLAKSVNEAIPVLNYPIMIATNNRYLYYLSRTDGKIVLIREKIRD